MKQILLSTLISIFTLCCFAQIENPILNSSFDNWFWTDSQDSLALPTDLYLPSDWTVGYRTYANDEINSIDLNPENHPFIDWARIKHTFYNYPPHTDSIPGYLKMVPDHDNYPYYYDFCFDPYAYQKIPFIADSINLNFDYLLSVDYSPFMDPGTEPKVVIEEYDNSINEYVEKMVWIADTSTAFQNDTLNINLDITEITDSIKIILTLNGYNQNQDYVIYDNIVMSYDTLSIDTTSIDTTTNLINIENDFFDIYPNPVEEILFLQFNNINWNKEIKIYDSTGKLVYQKINSDNSINVSQLKIGLYFLVIQNKNAEFAHKFYKK